MTAFQHGGGRYDVEFRGTAVSPGLSNNMRTGLERATSCHDHDGFQASPLQFLKGAVHVDVAPHILPKFHEISPAGECSPSRT